jgi:hypothetical protein
MTAGSLATYSETRICAFTGKVRRVIDTITNIQLSLTPTEFTVLRTILNDDRLKEAMKEIENFNSLHMKVEEVGKRFDAFLRIARRASDATS